MHRRNRVVVLATVVAVIAAAALAGIQNGAFATNNAALAAVSNALVKGVGSGRCLTLPASDGATATIQDCANQRWSVTSAGDLTSGGKCLDVWDHGTGDGALVSSWSCSGLANQKWQVNADGTIVGTESGRCLDVSGELTAAGTKVQLWRCTGGSNQRWSWQQ
jgi:hypothetical protein